MLPTKKVSCETKIRHHIISIIYHHPDETVKLPSTYKLAEELGVARSSVLTVIKKLRDEGFITGRRGVGLFSNPGSISQRKNNRRHLIGILIGKGDQFYHGKTTWHQAALTGEILTDLGCDVKLLSDGIGAESALSLNYKYRYVDAMLCIGSRRETIDEIMKYLPVAAVDRLYNAPIGVGFSYASAAVQWKQRLDSEGRKKFLCLIDPGNPWEPFRLQELFHDVFDFSSARFLSPRKSTYLEDLKKLLNQEQFDVIFGYQNSLEDAAQIMKERHIDYKQKSYLFAMREIFDDFSKSVFFMKPPYDQAIPIAAKMLVDKMNDIELKEPRQLINIELHIPEFALEK